MGVQWLKVQELDGWRVGDEAEYNSTAHFHRECVVTGFHRDNGENFAQVRSRVGTARTSVRTRDLFVTVGGNPLQNRRCRCGDPIGERDEIAEIASGRLVHVSCLREDDVLA